MTTTPLLLSHQQKNNSEVAVVAAVSGDGIRMLMDHEIHLRPGEFATEVVNPDKAITERLIEDLVCLYAEQANTEYWSINN